MNSSSKIFLFIILLFSASFSFAQKKDTVFVFIAPEVSSKMNSTPRIKFGVEKLLQAINANGYIGKATSLRPEKRKVTLIDIVKQSKEYCVDCPMKK